MSFLWGVATSGHQTEGGNTTSDTWFAEHVTPTVFREESGPACDGFHRWRDDLDLVAGLGLSAYRFSVEWARVEPVEGEFSAEALDHYAAIVDGCVERGLAPVVTYNHMTAPHWFAMRGGWLDPGSAEAFARYCGALTDRIGDAIAYAVTLNEPNLPRLLTWAPIPDQVRDLERATLEAASRAAGVERYRLANVALPEEFDALEDGMAAAHTAGRAAIKARRPDLPVGLSIAVVDDQAVGDGTKIRDQKRTDLYARWLRQAVDDDFVGVQNYERTRYDANGPVPDESNVHPSSLGNAVRYCHAEAGVPVLVTEHGMATDDDTRRAAFLAPSLDGLRAAIDDGVPVLGYLHWSLLDNFEWIFGYDLKLGLVAVDRETFARTPKPSAAEYARIVREDPR